MKINKLFLISISLLSFCLCLTSCVKNKRQKFSSFELGYYPQNIAITTIKEELDKREPNADGFITYNDITYKKELCTPYSDEYLYRTTKLLVDSGKYEYFEYMPISWRILEETDDYYFATTEDVLFLSPYAKETLVNEEYEPRDYKNSYIRSYLNDYIYNDILNADSSIIKTEVTNQYEYDSKYDSTFETLNDYVTLLSANDFTKEHKLNKSDDRYAFASDYLIATGAKTFQESPNAFNFTATDYFLRTKATYADNAGLYPNSESVYKIDWLGTSKEESVYSVIGLRPCITVDKKTYKENHSNK